MTVVRRTTRFVALVLLVCGAAAIQAQEIRFRLDKQATQVGLFSDPVLNQAHGMAWGDYDNDGWPDLFVAEQFRRGLGLIHNDGGRRFTTRTFLMPNDLVQRIKATGDIWGDYDNDGDLDLFVPIGDIDSAERDMLLRNDEGSFVPVNLEAGLTAVEGSDQAIWLDYDHDGWLDLLVGHINVGADLVDTYWMSINGSGEKRVVLYRNNGDGTFTDKTAAAGLDMRLGASDGSRLGGFAAADFNDDGRIDLYIAVEFGVDITGAETEATQNHLFLNNGDGTFTEKQNSDFINVAGASDVAVGDIDNDGDLDIFQAAFTNIQAGDLGFIVRSQLLLNLGDGEFVDVTEGVGLGALGATNVFSARLHDLDNDGDLDLFIPFRPHFFFANNGDGTFSDATDLSGIVNGTSSLADEQAFADVDLDGFLDVMMHDELWRNTANGNHYLQVELVGTASNRNGIGARLVATAGDLVQTREVRTGSGRYQDETVAHFGLGARAAIDRLEVRWPSGQVDVVEGIAADQQIRLIEGSNAYHPVQPMRWQHDVPDSTEAGVPLSLEATVQPALFDGSARLESVTADLSLFGGDDAEPLSALDDGTYQLSAVLRAPEEQGLYQVAINVIQQTAAGRHWSQVSTPLAVLPAGERLLFDEGPEPGWRLEARNGGQVEPNSTVVAHRGASSQAITLQPDGVAVSDTVLYILDEPDKVDEALWQFRRGYDRWYLRNPPPPPEPLRSAWLLPRARAGIDLLGYTHLSFYLYPGQARIDSLFIDIGGADGMSPAFFLLPAEVSIGPPDTALQQLLSGFTQVFDGNPFRNATDFFLSLILDENGDPTELFDPNLGLPNQEYIVRSGLGRRFLNLDLGGDDWVEVHVPLDSLRGQDEDLRLPFIRLRGGVQGTFYIDEMRLTRNPPGATMTAVLEAHDATTPEAFALAQNYPNPFNSGTVIRFALPQQEAVELTVFNMAGQKVATLVDGQRPGGAYTVHWDGADDKGQALATGMYLYRLEAGERSETKKLLLLR